MDVNLINPFLLAAVHVCKTMAFVEPSPGKPYVKHDQEADGDISSVVGLTGDASGSLAVSFSEGCALQLISSMLGEEFTSLDHEVEDAVGELTNMISGDARRRLADAGRTLKASIPTIITGPRHRLRHLATGPCLVVPFETAGGPFFIEVSFEA